MLHISKVLAFAMAGLGPRDIMRDSPEREAMPLELDFLADSPTPQGGKARKLQAKTSLRVAPAPGRRVKR
jgi:hypothetical protein